MSNIVYLYHRTASRFSAANRVNISGVTPALRASGQETIDSHHSEGMRSRSRHLRTRSLVVDKSEAIAAKASGSRDFQRSITSWNEFTRVMPSTIGQSVLDGKANLSTDSFGQIVQTALMPKDEKKTAFAKEFAKRVKMAREPHYTQPKIAVLLDIPQDHYKHFETKRVMPHHLVGLFCELTHTNAAWLFTGEGEQMTKRQVREKPAPDKAKAPAHKKRVA